MWPASIPGSSCAANARYGCDREQEIEGLLENGKQDADVEKALERVLVRRVVHGNAPRASVSDHSLLDESKRRYPSN